ncbi:MAG: RsmF rRNA methyltransferase first C-terminal domain-containing protein [Clostridia bacterium]|nr:RsmF rRNA methyltransferase first C-terminal domain-containing protein [Clostridia bacterium]
MNHPLPEAFLNNMQALLGDEYPAFLRALDAPAALALRLNPKRHGAEAAAMPYVDGPVPWCGEGRYLAPQGEDRPGSAIAHAAGAFYLQEASAMASAAVLDAKPGERVLDLCAAPGGKSTQIAAALAGRGLLVSNDPEPSRAQALAGNLERMGVSNAVVTCALPGRLADRWPERFDAILVDAPCSGEGMFRRDPASRDEWNPASPEGCARRQSEILEQAARMLRSGGRLVYSTCTFNAVENEGSVLGFLARRPDFAPEDFNLPGAGPSRSGMLRLFPHRLRGDGHFVARLRRIGEGSPDKASPIRPDRAVAAIMDDLDRDVCCLDIVDGMRFSRQGEWLHARPPACPDLDGLRVISAGLCLARLGRNHIEPAHALAMAIDPDCARRRFDLDETAARAWLRGEPVPCQGEKGWTLALYRGMPLGWGKVSDGMLKNHLPKGLRRF